MWTPSLRIGGVMSRIIIAIGGSGQMVLHHYAQLFLIGIVREPFRAYVLDTDREIASLALLSNYFENLARTKPGAERATVPSIQYIHLEAEADQGKVKELLIHGTLPVEPGYHHPAQAFFSRDFLEQDIREGLYARPGLSAVTTLSHAFSQIQASAFEKDSKVAIVCSCIGGTGGGLAIPIMWHIEREAAGKVTQRAVLLGDFFQSNIEQQRLRDQLSRFRSNRTLFLEALHHSVPDLKAFTLIEDPKMPERNPEGEAQARNLVWSEETLPYWRAACALDYLLVEAVTDVSGFVDREVHREQYSTRLSRSKSVERLQTGLGRVQGLIDQDAFRRLAREALPRGTWGKQLVNSLVSFANLHSGRSTAAYARPSEFIPEVGAWVSRWWQSGVGGSYGLEHIFPSDRGRRPRLGEIRAISWPVVSADSLDPNDFSSREDAARRCACALIHAALRYGA